MKIGDILWFISNQSSGGFIIGMSEFHDYFDKQDEPLIKVHKYTPWNKDGKGMKNGIFKFTIESYIKPKNKKFLFVLGVLLLYCPTLNSKIK